MNEIKDEKKLEWASVAKVMASGTHFFRVYRNLYKVIDSLNEVVSEE